MEQAHIYAYTHECRSKIYSSFIHSRFHIHIEHSYMFIDTLSQHLLFVLYYCTTIDSTIVAHCISSTALHPLSLQVVSGQILVVLHIFTPLTLTVPYTYKISYYRITCCDSLTVQPLGYKVYILIFKILCVLSLYFL
jgi:hypothetical protein